jgi:hypothetical protein
MKDQMVTGFETRAEGKVRSPVLGYETTHTSLERTSIPRIRSPSSSYFDGKSTCPGFTSMRQFCLLNILSSFRASSPSRGLYRMPLLQRSGNTKSESLQIPSKKRHGFVPTVYVDLHLIFMISCLSVYLFYHLLIGYR